MLEWLIALLITILSAVGASAPTVEPEPVEIGTALSCERVGDRVECVEIAEDGTIVREWSE